MTKAELLRIVEDMDDDDDVDFAEIERERQEYVEELEERQHMSGFYSFQDKMEMWRRER